MMRAYLIGLLASSATAIHNTFSVCSEEEQVAIISAMDEANPGCSDTLFSILYGAYVSTEDLCTCYLGLPEELAASTFCAPDPNAYKINTFYYMCKEAAGLAPPAPPCTLETLAERLPGEGHMIKCAGADLESVGDLNLDGFELAYGEFAGAYFYAGADIDLDNVYAMYADFEDALFVAGDDIKIKKANFNMVDIDYAAFAAYEDIVVRKSFLGGVDAYQSFWGAYDTISFEENYMPGADFYEASMYVPGYYTYRFYSYAGYETYFGAPLTYAFVTAYDIGGIKFADNYMPFAGFTYADIETDVGIYFYDNYMYLTSFYGVLLDADFAVEIFDNTLPLVDFSTSLLASDGGLVYDYAAFALVGGYAYELYYGYFYEGAIVGIADNIMFGISFEEGEVFAGAVGFTYNMYGTYANFKDVLLAADMSDNPFSNTLGIFYNDFAFSDWTGAEFEAGNFWDELTGVYLTYDYYYVNGYNYLLPGAGPYYSVGASLVYQGYYDGMVLFRGNNFFAADFEYADIEAEFRGIFAFDYMPYADLYYTDFEGYKFMQFYGVDLYGADLAYAEFEATDMYESLYIVYLDFSPTTEGPFYYYIDIDYIYDEYYYTPGELYIGFDSIFEFADMYSITLLGEAEVLFDGVDMYGAYATYALIAGEIDSSYFSSYDYTYGPFDFIGFVDTDFTGSNWYASFFYGGYGYVTPSYLDEDYYMYDYAGLFFEPSVYAFYSDWFASTFVSAGSIGVAADLTGGFFSYTEWIAPFGDIKFSYDAVGTLYYLYGDVDGDGFYDTYYGWYGYPIFGYEFADAEAELDFSSFYAAFFEAGYFYAGDFKAMDVDLEYADFEYAAIYASDEVDFSGSDLYDAYFEDFTAVAYDVIFFDGADLSKSDFDGSEFYVFGVGDINYYLNYYFDYSSYYYYYSYYFDYFYYFNYPYYDQFLFYYSFETQYDAFHLHLYDVHTDFWDEEGEHYRGIHFHDVNFKGADFEDTFMVTPSWIDMSSSNFRKSDFDGAFMYTAIDYDAFYSSFFYGPGYYYVAGNFLNFADEYLLPEDVSYYTYFSVPLSYVDFVDYGTYYYLLTSAFFVKEYEPVISGVTADLLYYNDATILFHGSDMKKSSWEYSFIKGSTPEVVDQTIKPSDSFLEAVGPRPPPSPPAPPPSPPAPPPGESPPPSPPYMGLMCICDDFRNGADETPYADVCGLSQGGTMCYPPQADGCGSATPCLVAPPGYTGDHFGCMDHLSSKKCSKNVKKGCTSKKAMKKCKSSCGLC